MAEFGEFLLAQKAQEPQGSDDQTPSGRDAWSQGLLQAFKAMVKLSTGQGVRPIRATDAVPFAAGVRLSLHANTKVVQHLAESYMQASRPRHPTQRRALPFPEDLPLADSSRRSPQSRDPLDPPLLPPPTAHMQPRPEEPPTRAAANSQDIGPDPSAGVLLQQPLNYLGQFQARDISSALRMTALNPCL